MTNKRESLNRLNVSTRSRFPLSRQLEGGKGKIIFHFSEQMEHFTDIFKILL